MHIVRRGTSRAATFHDGRDREGFLRWLGRYAVRYECRVHAYVLMGNHAHLLATGSHKGGLEALMQALFARHERYVNDAHGRAAALWEPRYEAAAIHVRRQLLLCMRYIELNPVRANLVRDPRAYHWSSHAANAYGCPDPLLTPHPVYFALGRTPAARQAAYLRMIGCGGAGRASIASGSAR